MFFFSWKKKNIIWLNEEVYRPYFIVPFILLRLVTWEAIVCIIRSPTLCESFMALACIWWGNSTLLKEGFSMNFNPAMPRSVDCMKMLLSLLFARFRHIWFAHLWLVTRESFEMKMMATIITTPWFVIFFPHWLPGDDWES